MKNLDSHNNHNDVHIASDLANKSKILPTVYVGLPIHFAYDADGMIVQAIQFFVTLDAQSGLLTRTQQGDIIRAFPANDFAERIGWQYSGAAALSLAASTVINSIAFGKPDTVFYGTVDNLQRFDGATATPLAGVLNPQPPATLTIGADTGQLLNTTLSRDKLGRITKQTDTIAAVTHTVDYGYDLAGRLQQVTRDGVPSATYSYDANGNRLSRTTPAGAINATYDDQDRMLSYGANRYTYRADGALKSKTTAAGTTTYDYDVLGNLRSVVLPDTTRIDYLIDARNRRIGKEVNGTLQYGLLYKDQLNPVAQLDEHDRVIERFVYAAKPNVPAYLIKIDPASGTQTSYRILSDTRGSPRLVVNTATGVVAQRIDYDEFGNITADSNAGFQPFGFAGGLYDGQTGLVRFGARDYDPETGRWTSKDPLLFAGMDTNLYAYVKNNPANRIDPFGLVTFSGGFGGGFQYAEGGANASTSISIDTTGKVCIQFTKCGQVGFGLQGGLGATFSVMQSNLCEGDSSSEGFFVEGAGGGFGGGISGSRDAAGNISGSAAKGFVGFGAAAGKQFCTTRTVCLN